MKSSPYRKNHPEDVPQKSFKWPTLKLWQYGVLIVLSVCAARGFDNYLVLSKDALTVNQTVFFRCMRDLFYFSSVLLFLKTC